MNYIIKSYQNIGNIYLKETRDNIRNKFKNEFDVFVKTQFDKNSTDIFTKYGLIVYYDENNLCEAVEIVKPANPLLNNIELLNMPYIEIFKFFKLIDDSIIEDDSGFTSNKLGFGIYAPNKDIDPIKNPESVIVFIEGYY
ncbi:MAG: hypothetical protein ACOYLE_05990 [Bacteroidales bacterium]